MDAPSGNRLALALLGAAAALGLLAWFFLHDTPEPAPAVVAPVARRAPAPPEIRAEPPTLRPAAAPAPPPEPDGGPTFGRFSLISPEATVSTQVRLLAEGRDEAFRETFLPQIRDKVTPEAIAACRKRLAESRVQPDWEVAEDSQQDGHRVQRVSMWGKSTTGFHDTNGAWLADSVWCQPTGVP